MNKLFSTQYIVFILIGVSSIIFCQKSFAENKKHDGNWWQIVPDMEKAVYITGYLEGTSLGRDFSCRGINKGDKKHDMCEKIEKSYEGQHSKYLKNVTNSQIVDGLNVFYEDVKNRKIDIRGAVWLVLLQISGESPEKMEDIILNWRKAASEN